MSCRKLLFGVVLVLLAPGTLLEAGRKPKDEPPPEFYPVTFVEVPRTGPTETGVVGGGASILDAEPRTVEQIDRRDLDEAPPECTPFRTVVNETLEEVRLKDPNDAWPVLRIDLGKWQKVTKYTTMKECLESLPKYQGRFTEEQIRDLEKGKVAAGMPFEFALMVLGPPDGPPSYLSILNPVTERADDCWSYAWVNLSEGVGLAAFFGFLGAGALGSAGASNNLGDMTKYLKVAAIAQIAEVAAWQTVLSRARFVSVQVGPNGSIRLVMAQ